MRGHLGEISRETEESSCKEESASEKEGSPKSNSQEVGPGEESSSQKESSGEKEVDNAWWVFLANCRGVDTSIFFPMTRSHETLAYPVSICSECSVIDYCLKYALDNKNEFGIWGGLREHERSRLLRENVREGQGQTKK